MHVIDVNSGNRSNKSKNQEDTALEVNIIAASEVARQLRLRDMGGIIVVDFIDMSNAANRKRLYNHLRDEMEDDRAKHKILPPTKFGLIQITRQRVRPEMNIKTREENPETGDDVERCPWLLDKIDGSGHLCCIYTIKPDHCRNFPEHRQHAAATGCRGYDKLVVPTAEKIDKDPRIKSTPPIRASK